MGARGRGPGDPDTQVPVALLSLTLVPTDTLLNVFLAIAVDNLANAQELTKVPLVGECFSGKVATCSWQIRTLLGMWEWRHNQSFCPKYTVPGRRHFLPTQADCP